MQTDSFLIARFFLLFLQIFFAWQRILFLSFRFLKLVFVEFFYFRDIWFVGHSVVELRFVFQTKQRLVTQTLSIVGASLVQSMTRMLLLLLLLLMLVRCRRGGCDD